MKINYNLIILILLLSAGMVIISLNFYQIHNIALFQDKVKSYVQNYQPRTETTEFLTEGFKLKFNNTDNIHSNKCFLNKEEEEQCIIRNIELNYKDLYSVKFNIIFYDLSEYLKDNNKKLKFNIPSLNFNFNENLKEKLDMLGQVIINDIRFEKQEHLDESKPILYSVSSKSIFFSFNKDVSLRKGINLNMMIKNDSLLYKIDSFDSNLILEGLIRNLEDTQTFNIISLVQNLIVKSDYYNIQVKKPLKYYSSYLGFNYNLKDFLHNLKLLLSVNPDLNKTFLNFKKNQPEFYNEVFFNKNLQNNPIKLELNKILQIKLNSVNKKFNIIGHNTTVLDNNDTKVVLDNSVTKLNKNIQPVILKEDFINKNVEYFVIQNNKNSIVIFKKKEKFEFFEKFKYHSFLE